MNSGIPTRGTSLTNLMLQRPLRAAVTSSNTRSTSPTEDQRCQEQHQENHEQYLGDTDPSDGSSPEAQYVGAEGDDQECNCPTQHGVTPLRFRKDSAGSQCDWPG